MALPHIVGMIPARLAATRLPGKVLLDIAGKPMVQHVVECAGRSRYLSEVLVATDSDEVRAVVESYGGRAVMTSPDHASGTDRLAEVARQTDCDLIVNLQGDEPLLRPDVIDAAITPFLDEDGLRLGSIATPITTAAEHLSPSAVKVVVDRQGFALYFSRCPIPYFRLDPDEALDDTAARVHPKSALYPLRHIGLYAYTKETLLWMAALPRTPLEITESLEQLRALENGCPIRVVEVDYSPLGVDTPEDLERVRRLMAGR
ncbi:MAG: 3-deoxy-manno-octulosonate cytidylyltransferase [Armatimonadetes bacterium]|nr:3-deoxy-manno-octulosonate cytidylyltransferase [Armatimonadota bacterium]